IELPDLCGPQATQAACTSGSAVVNGVVRVEERYDQTATVDVLGGYSSYNGAFAGAGFAMRNLAGLGLVWTVNATIGTKITDLETAFQIPKWLVPEWSPIAFRTDITGLYQQQDTPRFGLLTTEGASLALTQQWSRQRSGTTPARVLTWNLFRYDFRVRTREVDALRPIGTNQDESQVAVSTRTSSVGMTFDWEQRADRHGTLNPLSPEDGFRFEAAASYAESFLLGQDTFVKLSTTGSKFASFGDNKACNCAPLVLRGDLRGDWGIPLGGAVLLPEVERFFAGGDSTVRGYSDDRMATELIHVGVPPLGSNISQIRIIPAGGNIRVISSLDAQLRIWSVFAGALFSDAGMIANTWGSVTTNDIRPSVGMGLRALTPFGIGALEYAVPLRPQLGDDPRGRLHFYFAARAQF
ncbi:MAG TPA: BamA/TamA family outer membrane protein, partial [Kofleriaceae bacterium]|nr:BamA/TamA family outer membrane protein [Kofleriaceae bacterium]